MPPIPQKQKIHPDFLRFAEMELASCDFDAEHPLIIQIAKDHQLDLDHKLWLCFLYMAFYDEASAWVLYQNSEPFEVDPAFRPYISALPIGKNRRNLYGNNVFRHLDALCEIKRSIPEWPLHTYSDDVNTGVNNWLYLKESIGSVWGNGRFATFTTAELIQKVLNINIVINGLDNKGSTGPADGISRAFYCDKKEVKDLDKFGLLGYDLMNERYMKPTYTDMDLGVAESIYCTFGATCRGKYYPGRNVDRQQGRIIAVENLGYNLKYLWELRGVMIDNIYLGEMNNWTGIDKDRLKLYKEKGVLLCPNENR